MQDQRGLIERDSEVSLKRNLTNEIIKCKLQRPICREFPDCGPEENKAKTKKELKWGKKLWEIKRYIWGLETKDISF